MGGVITCAGNMPMMYQRMMGGGGMGMISGFTLMIDTGMGMRHFSMDGMGGVGTVNPMATAADTTDGGNVGMHGAGTVGMRLEMGPIGMTGTGTGIGGIVVAAMVAVDAGMSMGTSIHWKKPST